MKKYLGRKFVKVSGLIILISILFLLLPLFFPRSYIGELIISFLPYLVGWTAIALIFCFVMQKKTPREYLSHRFFRILCFVILGFLFFQFSRQSNRFYSSPQTSDATLSGTVKILYANIHKYNTQYDEIKNLITETDPDVVMFVEFADHHYAHLKDFLQENYPYINSTTWSQKFVGSTVFSKYPLKNLAFDFKQGMRRYGYFSITFHQQPVYFYLVHVSSPDSYTHFQMRNEQLQSFIHDSQTHALYRTGQNTVIVGDFNLTPWSTYYNLLNAEFSGTLVNITQQVPFLCTWSLIGFPLLKSHIDHVRVNPTLQVSSFKVVNIPGSDHEGFLFSLDL